MGIESLDRYNIATPVPTKFEWAEMMHANGELPMVVLDNDQIKLWAERTDEAQAAFFSWWARACGLLGLRDRAEVILRTSCCSGGSISLEDARRIDGASVDLLPSVSTYLFSPQYGDDLARKAYLDLTYFFKDIAKGDFYTGLIGGNSVPGKDNIKVFVQPFLSRQRGTIITSPDGMVCVGFRYLQSGKQHDIVWQGKDDTSLPEGVDRKLLASLLPKVINNQQGHGGSWFLEQEVVTSQSFFDTFKAKPGDLASVVQIRPFLPAERLTRFGTPGECRLSGVEVRKLIDFGAISLLMGFVVDGTQGTPFVTNIASGPFQQVSGIMKKREIGGFIAEDKGVFEYNRMVSRGWKKLHIAMVDDRFASMGNLLHHPFSRMVSCVDTQDPFLCGQYLNIKNQSLNVGVGQFVVVVDGVLVLLVPLSCKAMKYIETTIGKVCVNV